MTHVKGMIPYSGVILILTMMIGCVSTTNVDAPDQVEANSSFQAVITIEADEDGWPDQCFLGVLAPDGWEADSVFYTGSFSGSMNYCPGSWPSSEFELYYPSSPLDHWISFYCSLNQQEEVYEGELFEINVTIYTDSLTGSVEIAFLGVLEVDVDGWAWNGDPCSTSVEVVELNLEQSTWGRVKSEFEP